MPFLRFSRDKRGYANTYLCHTFREDGAVRMRVLYWFRTPPDIAVGRPALDGQAIRDIEASNPGLTFDWDEILKAKPPPPARDDAGRAGRERRPRRRGRGAAGAGGGLPAEANPDAAPAPASEGGTEAPPGGSADAAEAPGARRGRRRRRRRRGGSGGNQRSATAHGRTAVEPDSDPA